MNDASQAYEAPVFPRLLRYLSVKGKQCGQV